MNMTMNDRRQELIDKMNKALGWEMRAQAMYAHYAAYVKGINRLHLSPYFEAEAAESVVHGNQVRAEIVKLGGIAVTTRDAATIPHTTDYKEMLGHALETEQVASRTYKEILSLVDDGDELYDVIQQIYYAEARAVKELEQLL